MTHFFFNRPVEGGSMVDELPTDLVEKNTFYDDQENQDSDFDFNQDFESQETKRSPGWIRYQKRLK